MTSARGRPSTKRGLGLTGALIMAAALAVVALCAIRFLPQFDLDEARRPSAKPAEAQDAARP